MSLPGLLLAAVVATPGSQATPPEPPDIALFFQAAQPDAEVAEEALAGIAAAWRDDYAAMLVDMARLMRPPREPRSESGGRGFGVPANLSGDDLGSGAAGTRPRVSTDVPGPGLRQPEHPSTPIRRRLIRFLEQQTGQRFGQDLHAWRRWYWAREYAPHPDYRVFKAALYGNIDVRMAHFFAEGEVEGVRLDEIDWGGVGVNGIPPLDHPTHVSVSQAGYLDDDHIVFGIEVGGEARAYPRRILAWHEMALDRLGGVELAVVYCTLCGTVIPYESQAGSRHFTLGTSGLLYRSNKLMFDAETLSLWNTVEGRPVLGPLAGTDTELAARPVVTTRWGEWRRAHPDTTVLSLDTGHERDYSEGAAYREYFRTDRLMFAVPRTDDRLDNKDEVLALLLRPSDADARAERRALAISADFLRDKSNRLFHHAFQGHDLVVVTTDAGANRVYEVDGLRFSERLDRGARLEGEDGSLWRVTEAALVPEDAGAKPLPRVVARRAFWFGWFAQYPETELIR